MQNESQEPKDRRTALITGASSGIGEVFARRLAADGYDLVLVARREDLLNRLREELQGKHGITVEVCVADLAKTDNVNRVTERIAEISNLEMLVNNAGFGTADDFTDCDIERHLDMIQVHVIASVRFTRAALSVMTARQRGAVINVSSVAAFLSGRGSCTYCATKAYLNSFSESLQVDLQGTGVRVQALCPGFTYSGFHDTAAFKNFRRSQLPRFLWLSADYVVDCSLRALKGHRVICIPSLRYRLLVAAVRNPITGPILRALFEHRADRRGLVSERTE